MTGPTSTYQAWKRISGRPGGPLLFSAAAMTRAPYFPSILPHVVRMEPGLAEVTGAGTEVVHADITTWVTPAG